jgi:hypothetical protein
LLEPQGRHDSTTMFDVQATISARRAWVYASRVMLRCLTVGALAAAVLAACGGRSSTSTAAAPGATDTGSATPTAAGHPRPAELQAAWRLDSGPTSDPVRLYLRETTYTATRGAGSHAGEVEADGDVLKFTAICGGSNVEGVGRYRWTLEGNALHLDLLGRDECSGRSAILENATYKRSG